MGGICSVCCGNTGGDEEEPTAMTKLPNRIEPERKASTAISILDPQTFEFVDALHLSKETMSSASLSFDVQPRNIPKRNSLTAWLAGGLFSSRPSRLEASGLREKTQMRPIKMLMSGAGESGKSTVIKQMKIIHRGGFTTEELSDFRIQIYRNIQESILQVLDCMDNTELTRDERTLEAVWRVKKFKPIFEELESLPEDYVSAINFLWVELIRNSFELIMRKTSILDSAPYFFDEINRISKIGYVPSNEDVLRARITTTGINEFKFKSGPLTINMVDVGGQRSERRKWIETFDNVTTLIFCVALSEYDLMLREEPRQNRLLESFQLWESVINSKWFQRTSVVLFLNKKDIFRQKLRTNPLSRYFSEYKPLESTSEEVNYEHAAEFLKNKFLAMNYGRLQIYPYLTCATDTKNIDMVFAAVKETVLANNLRSADSVIDLCPMFERVVTVADRMKVAIVQMLVGNNKQHNLSHAISKIGQAHEGGAKLVVLPECFNSPYGTSFFGQYAEDIPNGESTKELAMAAQRYGIWVVGGTIPERSGGRLYNACTVYSPSGEMMVKYRKMHLFDIDIPGKITFRESEILSAGNSFATFDLDHDFKVGLGICYDLRFPEFSSVLSNMECNVLVFPGAFNTVTGPMHWHLLQRGRAVDNQSYIITASPARNPDSEYQAYGHSLVVSPTGQIVAEAGEDEEIIYADLNLTDVIGTRRNIPSLQQKRIDIYSLPTRADRHKKRGYHEVKDHGEDPIMSLEQTVFNMGNKHPTLTIEEDIKQTSEILRREFDMASGRLADAIVACVLELPHKLGHYVKLLKLLEDKSEMIRAVLECLAEHLRNSATNGPWRHFSQSLRCLAACGSQGILAQESIDSLLNDLLRIILEGEPNPRTADFLIWSIGAAIPLIKVEGINGAMRDKVKRCLESRSRTGPSVPADVIELWRSIDAIPSSTSIEESEGASLKMNISLTSIIVDEHWDGDYRFFDLFEDSYYCTGWEKWSLLYSCRVLVESMELNHRRCAELLLNGLPSQLGNVEKIIVEFLFGELIRLRRNKMHCLVYESLLMDCCRLSRLFPPVMAKGLYLIFDRLQALGYIATDKLSSWFSHHLSNFDFKWNWVQWEHIGDSHDVSMQTLFVRSSIEKLAFLSYKDRVFPSIPKKLAIFLPEDAIPRDGLEEADMELSRELVKAIQSRQSIDEIKSRLGESEHQWFDTRQQTCLLTSLLIVGSKSFSHLLAVIEKYLPLFQLLLPPQGYGDANAKMSANFTILDRVSGFWVNSPRHFEFIVERLIHYRILVPKAVISWAIGKIDYEMEENISLETEATCYRIVTTLLSRNLIFRTIHQSSLMPSFAQKKMCNISEEKAKTIVAALTSEFEEMLTFTIEKLGLLPAQLGGMTEIVAIVEIVAFDYIQDLIFTYPSILKKLASSSLQSLGSKHSERIRVLLEQAQ